MAYIQDWGMRVQAQPQINTTRRAFLHLSQNENGRMLNIRITDVNIPSGSTAVLAGTKPDGTVYSQTGTLAGNTATFAEDVQMTAVAGTWDAKITITNGGNCICTARITITIDPDTVAGGAIPSDSQLDGIIAECRAIADSVRKEAYGSPLVADAVEDMTDQSRVYVYTGSESGMTAGHWYYYNGSAWADGGVYNAVAVDTDTTLTIAGKAADAKKVGDELTSVKEDLNSIKGDLFDFSEEIPINTAVTGYYALNVGVGNPIGEWKNSTGYAQTIVDANEGDEYQLYGYGADAPRLWAFLGTGDIILSVANSGTTVPSTSPIVITAPTGTKKAVFTVQKASPFEIKKQIPNYIKDDAIIENKINALVQTVEKTANKNDRLFHLYSTYGWIASDGTITESNAYRIYTYIASENQTVWFDAPAEGDVVIIATYKNELTAFTSTGLKRRGASIANTLPLVNSKMSISAGDYVAISIDRSKDILYHYNKTELKNSVINPPDVLQKIVVQKITDGDIKLRVFVPNEQETGYCRYDFCHYYKKWDSLGGATDVVSSDYWNNLFVYDNNGRYVAQGNSNFITLIYGDTYHTGDGHGNEVAKFVKFIADGEEVDIDNMVDGETVDCSSFRMIEKTEIYKLGGGTGNDYDKTYPALDSNNNPIVNMAHYINMEFSVGNIVKIDNRLEMKRDNIKFSQCHGAMLQCYFGDFTDIIINNAESTHNLIASDGTVTVADDSTINLRTNGVQSGNIAEMFSDYFYIKQTMQNVKGYDGKSVIDCTFYNDRLKCYFMPVKCGVNGDVFNTGDFIHVLCERKIDV